MKIHFNEIGDSPANSKIKYDEMTEKIKLILKDQKITHHFIEFI
jgi:hypothetical protein